MFGLVGCHRTGKSTLAQAVAEQHGMRFMPTSVTQYIGELGVTPADLTTRPFEDRLNAQIHILRRLNEFYQEIPMQDIVITDRTPLDLLMYTVAEVHASAVSPELQKRYDEYVKDCFDSANRWFSTLMIVQPGIPVQNAEGKGVINEPYMEHLNSLVIGLAYSNKLKVPYYIMPRSRVDLDERVSTVKWCYNKTVDSALVSAMSGHHLYH